MQTQLIAGAKPPLLPEPPSGLTPTTPSGRECQRAWEEYVKAYSSYIAIDHPESFWRDLSEPEKAKMRADRRPALDRTAVAYLDAVERADRNAKRRQAKKEKATSARAPREQMRLFESAWPPSFDYIAERFPYRPRVSNDLEAGSTVRSRSEALGWRYIQHNQPTMDHVIVIDYDAPDGIPVHEIWQMAGLKKPTWIAATDGTPRGHLAYAIAAPVCTSDAARLGPLRYLAAIEAAYRNAVNGDRGYSGLLTKNPVHPDAWQVDWLEPRAYTLAELAEPVTLPKLSSRKALPPVEPIGLGRKVLTFDTVRHWAYVAIRQYWALGADAWHRAVRQKVDEIGQSFEDPLPESHRRSIAKSIAKWTWRNTTPESFALLIEATPTPAVQALSGRQKGAQKREEKMAEALAMLDAGQSLRDVAKAVGVSPKTIGNWRDRAANPAPPVSGLH